MTGIVQTLVTIYGEHISKCITNEHIRQYSDHSGSDPEEVFLYTSQKDHMLILADTRITTDMSAEF